MARPTNSTYLSICDTIAKATGLNPAVSAAAFNDDTQLPSKYVIIKMYVDIASRLAVMRMNERWLKREFQIFLSQGTNYPYPLDDTVSAEGLVYHSFRCTTPGAARDLYAWKSGNDDSYLTFRKFYPDLTAIPTGAPTSYVLVPIQSNEVNAHELLVYPTPDSAYTLQYQAKINPVQLVLAADLIQFPKEYEVALITTAKALFTSELGKGDPSLITSIAEQAVAATKAWASGPLEGRNRQRMSVMMRPNGSRATRFDVDGRAGW